MGLPEKCRAVIEYEAGETKSNKARGSRQATFSSGVKCKFLFEMKIQMK